MMRAIYARVTPTFWLDAARHLRDRLGWQPVWWLAAEPRERRGAHRARVRATFPGVVWHDMGAAMRGRWPSEVRGMRPSEPGAALLRDLAYHETIALHMMDRQDPDGASFTYAERRHHWLDQVRGWCSVIDHVAPDVVVFPTAPHLVTDYVLYACARARGVRTIVIDSDWRFERLLVADDIGGGSPRLRAGAPPGGSVALAPSTEEALARLRGTYDEAAPEHDQVARARQPRPPAPLRAARVARKAADRAIAAVQMAGDDAAPVASGARQYLKAPGVPLAVAPPSVAAMARIRRQGNRRAEVLRRAWASRVSVPEPPSEPYVYVPLHFQPERTTSPDGGEFVDQVLAVRLLAAARPSGWSVVVREHPATFLRNRPGYRGRVVPSYEAMAELEGVRLAPAHGDPMPWLDGAAVVATVTGTSGWEAVVRGTHALVFGGPWYRGAPGVHEVRDVASVRAALTAASVGPPDDEALRRWVGLLDEHPPGCNEPLPTMASLSDDVNGRALAEAIVDHLERTGGAP